MKRFQLLAVLLAVLGLSACEDCSFESDYVQTVKVSFFRLAETEARDTSFTQIYGIGVDADIYPVEGADPSQKIKVFSLPLNPNMRKSSFVFVKGTVRDTLHLSYDVTLRPYTPDCGYDVIISNLKDDNSTFSNVKIVSTNLKWTNKNDIEIRN